MRAGLLTETITIYENYVEKDNLGFEKSTLEKKLMTRARVEHKSGNRANENGEIVYSNFDTFTVRHYVSIEPTDIIMWNNRKYRILYISPDSGMQHIKIEAELVNE